MKIYLIYHSHIDNGYTERQERIALYQADFIHQAVECALSPAQAARDEKSRFKFTAEGFWAVEQYMKKYGENGKRRLLEAVKAGYFELTACYFHLAELLDKDDLGHSLDYVRAFARENGLAAPDLAMAADINGFSWGFADCLADRGVKYLSANINVHQGGYPLGKPFRPFFWRTADGRKILVFSGMPYHKANQLGLIPGYRLGGDPGVPGMPQYPVRGDGAYTRVPGDMAADRVFGFLDYLEREDYPLDIVPIMGSGLYTDNSPADDGHCRMIAEWNEEYGDRVEIVTATQGEFFRELMKRADRIPECAGDWNDYWTDGALSYPGALRLFRNAQREKRLIRKLDPEGKIVSDAELEDVRKNLILFAEHTYGHSASISSPENLLVKQLEYRKIGYATQADAAAGRLRDKLARALGEAEFTTRMPFSFRAVNPHDRPVTFPARFPLDYWELIRFDGKGFRLTDEAGNRYAVQALRDLRGLSVCAAATLGPRETRRFALEPGDGPADEYPAPQGRFENDYYRLAWDETGIISLTEKSGGEELLLPGKDGLAAPVYQKFGMAARSECSGSNFAPRKHPEGRVSRGRLTEIVPIQTGPVFTVLRLAYEVEGCQSYQAELTLYRAMPRIDVRVKYVKDLVRAPEGLYAAFPLQAKGGAWNIAKTDLLFSPDDLLPGVCHDYFTVGQGAALMGSGGGVALNTLDTPLIMLGGLNLWRYGQTVNAAGVLYSWLTNNKWDTNFGAECSGCHESRYSLHILPGANSPREYQLCLDQGELEPMVVRG